MADEERPGSEQGYRELFEEAPISLWEQDFSRVKEYLDQLRAEGVSDFDEYFQNDLEAFARCARLVRVIDVNRHTLRLYGARSKQELYDNLDRTVPAESYAFFRDQLVAIAGGRAAFQGEVVNLDLRGERLHLFLKWVVSPGSLEDYSRVLVTVADETERVEAEGRFRAAMAEWRDTFEAVQDLIFILDPDFRVVRANAAAERFFGRSGGEMQGLHCYDLVHGSREPVEGCPLEAMPDAGEHREAELYLDNHGIWAQITVDPVYDEDGGLTGVVHVVKDITARKRAEERLKESERLYRMLADNTQDLICVCDTDLVRRYVSPSYQTVLGYEPEELTGMSLFSQVPPGEEEARKEEFRNTVKEGYSGTVRQRLRHKDGRYVWIDTKASLLRGEDGEVAGFLIASRDVDRQAEAEERLRESERLYRMLADNTQDLVCLCDLEGIRLYVSPSYRTYLGYEPEELLGGHILSILHPDDLERVAGELEDGLKEGKRESSRHRLRHKDGHYLWVDARGTPLLDEKGELVAGLAVSWDITGQVEAEERLRESERLYRMLADNTQDLIVMFDAEGINQYISPSIRNLLGYEPEELLGKPVFGMIHPDDLAEAGEVFKTGMAAGTAGVMRIRDRHKDGHYVWLETKGNVLFDDGGRPVGALTVSRDVTVQVEAEERLKQERGQLLSIFDSINQVIYVSDPATYQVLYVNRHLCEILGRDPVGGLCYREFQGFEEPCGFCTNPNILGSKGEPYVWEYHNPVTDRDYLIVDRIIGWPPDGRDARFELAVDITDRKRAEEELRETNEQLKGFLSVAAHELRHPINLVQGYVGTLKDFREDSSPEMLEEIDAGISRASGRLVRLVEELLEVSRIEQERFAVALEPARPRELVVEAVEELKVRGVGNRFEIRAGEMPEAWPLDQDRFRQLMVILLENAVSYSPVGSPVEVELEAGGEVLAVSVLDRGRGVGEEDRELIFQRFYQVDDPRHHSVPGLGMGLYVAREIVGLHGGEIRCEPRPGGGSAFRVTLPRAASPPPR